MTLYEISQALNALYERIEELGGDVTDAEVEQVIDGWFADLHEARDEKIDNYAALIRELQARAEARRAEARRLTDRARRDEEQAAYLQNRLAAFMNEQDLRTIETRRYRLTLARSGGPQPVVLKTDDAEALPPAFQRVKVSADLTAIREALERGEALDFAELGERSIYLRIR